jgi:hypothetical protein
MSRPTHVSYIPLSPLRLRRRSGDGARSGDPSHPSRRIPPPLGHGSGHGHRTPARRAHAPALVDLHGPALKQLTTGSHHTVQSPAVPRRSTTVSANSVTRTAPGTSSPTGRSSSTTRPCTTTARSTRCACPVFTGHVKCRALRAAHIHVGHRMKSAQRTGQRAVNERRFARGNLPRIGGIWAAFCAVDRDTGWVGHRPLPSSETPGRCASRHDSVGLEVPADDAESRTGSGRSSLSGSRAQFGVVGMRRRRLRAGWGGHKRGQALHLVRVAEQLRASGDCWAKQRHGHGDPRRESRHLRSVNSGGR